MYRRGSTRRETLVRVRSPSDVEALFRAYYRLRPELGLPPDFDSREFAFQPWRTDSYVRHKSFNTVEELHEFLAAEHPRQAHFSIAVYEIPDAPRMEEKSLQRAWLMFDVDIDPGECGLNTPILGDECLEKAYTYAERIALILERDFDMKTVITFTGHRGFHVIAGSEESGTLGKTARRRIAEYVEARGLDVWRIIPRPRKGARPVRPTRDDPGWRGWVAHAIQGIGDDWLDRLEEALAEWRPRIDALVTQDPSRLERIHGSLHGKAGLLAVPMNHGLLLSARVLSPFRGEVEVVPREDVEATLLGYKITLRRGRREPVPAWLGLYLALRGLVDGIEGEVVVRAHTGWRPLQDGDWPP